MPALGLVCGMMVVAFYWPKSVRFLNPEACPTHCLVENFGTAVLLAGVNPWDALPE